MPEMTFPTRRGLLSFAATAAIVGALPKVTFASQSLPAIREFRFEAAEKDIRGLKDRILATRWPEKETVSDHSQGVRLDLMQPLAEYWASSYDWRKCEEKLNRLPNFVTEIDGLEIHFIHVRSKHPKALPVIVTHGWPGSILEQMKIIEPLTDPTAYGGNAEDAFDVVVPSVPGYGFSGKPQTSGWGPDRIGRAWIELMGRLGYKRFVAQGGDIGAIIATSMAIQAPKELLGIHVNFPGTLPAEASVALQRGGAPAAGYSEEEKRAYLQVQGFRAKHFAYATMMATRPQTLYGLSDSLIGLAAWILDHGDGYEQPAAAMISAIAGKTYNGHDAGAVTRDDVLDNITLYWLTNTAVSAARFYWENGGMSALGAVNVSIPAAVSVFPGEIYQAPRSWTEQAYSNLVYFNSPKKGGHFAAWEQPEIFTQEMRAGFRSLRDAI